MFTRKRLLYINLGTEETKMKFFTWLLLIIIIILLVDSCARRKKKRKEEKRLKKIKKTNKKIEKLKKNIDLKAKKNKKDKKKRKSKRFKRFLVRNFACEGIKRQSITIAAFCDGKDNCKNGNDEITNVTKAYSITRHPVKCDNAVNNYNGECYVSKRLICNGKVLCDNVSPCDLGCASYFTCPDGTCLPRTTLCDGDTCNDCPTLESWKNGHGFKCARNGVDCIVPQVVLYDGIKDCDGGKDLCFATANLTGNPRDIRNSSLASFNQKLCFQCLDQSMIISRHSTCDGKIDCPDMSDECLCEGPVLSICNRIQTVNNLIGNENCSFGEVVCPDKTCISRGWVCDGEIDCDDGYDEAFSYCRGTKPCENVTVAGERCRCSRMAEATCNQKIAIYCNDVAQCIKTFGTENRFLEPAEDECYGVCPFLPTNPNITTLPKVNCSDVGTLKTLKDFKCPTKDGFFVLNASEVCNGQVQCNVLGRSDEAKDRCKRWRFRCPTLDGNVNIPKSQLCDGYINCKKGNDEMKKYCEPRGRYYCSALGGLKVSISKSQICDFIINCDDQSDELNCTKDGRFYCENKQPLFVRKRDVFNGVKDCSDWSDECPSVHPPGYNPFSSRYHLIANPALRVIVWIMAIFALVGNVYVVINEINAIRTSRSRSATLLANHLMVINLAAADSLMGIYLLMLATAGLRYSGVYCAHDLHWRSSDQCTAMGILVVLSSETSVLTMVVFASFRLFAVLNPFSAGKHPKLWLVILLIALTWGVAFIIGMVPINQKLQNTFTDAWIQSNPFLHSVVVKFPNFKIFLDRLTAFTTYKNATVDYAMAANLNKVQQSTSWWQFTSILDELQGNKLNFTISTYFGYYSSNSVCIPMLFVTPLDRAWRFSFSTTVVNFLAFIFVSVAYIVIYHQTVGKMSKKMDHKTKKGKGHKQNKAIQKKIIRLIITDFCCWVPISVMAFINFGGIHVPPVAYAFSAIILLPINSALNPIIYSDLLDKCYELVTCKKPSETTDTTSTSTFKTTVARSSSKN